MLKFILYPLPLSFKLIRPPSFYFQNVPLSDGNSQAGKRPAEADSVFEDILHQAFPKFLPAAFQMLLAIHRQFSLNVFAPD